MPRRARRTHAGVAMVASPATRLGPARGSAQSRRQPDSGDNPESQRSRVAGRRIVGHRRCPLVVVRASCRAVYHHERARADSTITRRQLGPGAPTPVSGPTRELRPSATPPLCGPLARPSCLRDGRQHPRISARRQADDLSATASRIGILRYSAPRRPLTRSGRRSPAGRMVGGSFVAGRRTLRRSGPVPTLKVAA